MVAFRLIASNLPSVRTTVDGIELTVTKVSVSDAIDGRIPLRDVSAATGVGMSLPASLLDAIGVERALVLVASLPASAAPAGAPVTQVEGAVSISLKSVEDGLALSVTGLPDPIVIDLLNESDGLACAYFDRAALEWSSEGMATTRRADGALRCATARFTVFGAMLKGILSSLERSQASLLSAESYAELWTGDWSGSAGSVLLRGVMLLSRARATSGASGRAAGARRGPVACPTTRANGCRAETGAPRVALLGAERASATKVLRVFFCLEGPSRSAVGTEDLAAAGAPRAAPPRADRACVAEALREQFCEKWSDGSVATVGATRLQLHRQGPAVGQLQSARQAVQQGAKAYCEELLQGAFLEVVSIVAKCVDGARQAVEVFVIFARELLRGNFSLEDLAEMLAERNATNQVFASRLVHPGDVDFLLSPEGVALRAFAGLAAEGGVAKAERRRDVLSEVVGRARAARESSPRRRRSRCHAARALMLSFLINCPVGAGRLLFSLLRALAVTGPALRARRRARRRVRGCKGGILRLLARAGSLGKGVGRLAPRTREKLRSAWVEFAIRLAERFRNISPRRDI
ncbi:unnamed protein product [Prorocentrum cordatum]|uniref:Uncharacterized protein n=1 Tax=Prorocentrum cordatum TaxID=2364126 RepID=A0ABN9PD50_9DINO|nr:unnamed protein product [Polarella glacialis]